MPYGYHMDTIFDTISIPYRSSIIDHDHRSSIIYGFPGIPGGYHWIPGMDPHRDLGLKETDGTRASWTPLGSLGVPWDPWVGPMGPGPMGPGPTGPGPQGPRYFLRLARPPSDISSVSTQSGWLTGTRTSHSSALIRAPLRGRSQSRVVLDVVTHLGARYVEPWFGQLGRSSPAVGSVQSGCQLPGRPFLYKKK